MRRKHRVFTTIISETGVSYTTATGKIDGSDERWERWLRLDKVVGSIKKYGCPKYPKLCIIYGDTTATGNDALPSTQEIIDSSSEDQSKEVSESIMDKTTELANELKGKAKSKGKKRKAVRSTFSSTIEKAIVDMAEMAKMKNEMRMASQANSSIRGPLNEVTSPDKDLDIMTECMKVLDDLDVDADIFVKALDILHDQPLKRGLFLRMTEKRRMEWLGSLV
ncbi:unnamed protein product [Linum trigynum]|uniref:L10-interacting MYB domain-containing protein-like n=1 Tax=Linum trigynum TaxID=586398 RepID=A0AAV2ED58_9ROSI